MAKFLKNHGISEGIENLIRNANRKLVLISPYWQLSDPIKRTLQSKVRDGLSVQAVYRDEQQRPEDIDWLEQQQIPALSLTNLHAKCYINEIQCIVTSLNLYERDQVHNLEMGILIDRQEDADLYAEVAKEVSIILAMTAQSAATRHTIKPASTPTTEKLSEAQLAKKLGLDKTHFKNRMVANGYLKLVKNNYELTEKGLAAGGEWKHGANGRKYRVWPEDFEP